MYIIICPDSFKNTLSSKEVGIEMKKAILKVFPTATVNNIVMADGGEGSLDAIENVFETQRVYVDTVDAYGNTIVAYYLVKDDTAYLEMANSVGLNVLNNTKLDILNSSSRGFGIVLKAALNSNVKNINIFIGGSATNDAGIAAMNELGVKYYDKNDNELRNLKSKDLAAIERIDVSILKELILNKNITMMSDVFNPLIDTYGATKMYAKQKGATEEEVEFLENSMKKYCMILEKQLSVNVARQKCAGAAGGMGSAIMSYLKADIKMGAEYILDINNFDEISDSANVIITGEGRVDSQSSMGKVVSTISNRVEKTPVVVFCGEAERGLNLNVLDIVSIAPRAVSLSRSFIDVKELLYLSVYNYFKPIERMQQQAKNVSRIVEE